MKNSKPKDVSYETVEYSPETISAGASDVQDRFLYGKSVEKLKLGKDVKGSSGSSDWAIYRTGGGSIPNNTQTNITWSNGTSSKASMLGTNQFILPETGVYQLSGTIRWNTNSSGYRQTLLLVGGSFIIASVVPNNGGVNDEYNMISAIFQGNSGQSVRLEVFQNSGTAISIISSSRMGIFRIA